MAITDVPRSVARPGPGDRDPTGLGIRQLGTIHLPFQPDPGREVACCTNQGERPVLIVSQMSFSFQLAHDSREEGRFLLGECRLQLGESELLVGKDDAQDKFEAGVTVRRGALGLACRQPSDFLNSVS